MYGHAWGSANSHHSRNQSTLSKLSLLGNSQSMVTLRPNLQTNTGSGSSTSSPRPSMASGNFDVDGGDASGEKDMRQVRLFKTRFCSYGSDCPYLARGKCLYAHNKDEIRFRPPPPASYKVVPTAQKPPAIKHALSLPLPTSTASVWAPPDSKSSPTSSKSFSLLDFLPPVTATLHHS